MNYHQFRRFMWFPLLRRFLWSWSAFKYAWKNIHPTDHWAGGYTVWQSATQEFAIHDLAKLKGLPPMTTFNGVEPYMLKKRYFDEHGNVRFGDVIPINGNALHPSDWNSWSQKN